VVIGGGASGAYAAVRLRDDFNKSIALIEKQSILVSLVPRASSFQIALQASDLTKLPANANVKST
jgi:succinate dehydrogenase/fumarate reductase flavoprotein subunit